MGHEAEGTPVLLYVGSMQRTQDTLSWDGRGNFPWLDHLKCAFDTSEWQFVPNMVVFADDDEVEDEAEDEEEDADRDIKNEDQVGTVVLSLPSTSGTPVQFPPGAPYAV